MARGRVISPKRRKRMAQRAFQADNARPPIASMAFVATPRVPERVWRARRPKKAAVQMEYAVRLLQRRIQTRNAMAESVTEPARVDTTMAHRAPRPTNASRIIASMGFAAETRASVHAMRVRRRKKAVARTACVARLAQPAIRTMSAILANAMAWALATSRRTRSRMVRRARWRRNAYQASVSMAFVAILLARKHAKRVAQRKKAAALMARVA